MRTIDKVLQLLENNKEKYISGEDMAKTHGISRNAIWKAIKELRSKGYLIDAVSNRGYRLLKSSDIISGSGVISHLDPSLHSLCEKIYVYDSTGSTNDMAKEFAMKGANHGTVVIASSQSGGRGRKDHTFFSPEGGLYMSIILRPESLHFTESKRITSMVGTAVCDAIKELTGKTPEIKGINDLYLDGKKICGILIEAGSEFDSGVLQWIVAGIGINFESDINDFPPEIKEKAASLFAPGKAGCTRNALAGKIISNILIAS